MKLLFGDLRYGAMRRRYSGVVERLAICGEPLLPYEKIDSFRLWGLVIGDTFLGFMTRHRARPILGKHIGDDVGALRGEE